MTFMVRPDVACSWTLGVRGWCSEDDGKCAVRLEAVRGSGIWTSVWSVTFVHRLGMERGTYDCAHHVGIRSLVACPSQLCFHFLDTDHAALRRRDHVVADPVAGSNLGHS